jgi:hypothetical protein
MPTRVRSILFVALILLVPSAAYAQGLSTVLIELLKPDIILAPPPPTGTTHEAHFRNQFQLLQTADLFNQQIVTQLATFPTGSSSGGFSFMRDPATGRMTRASDSFGPSFSERALTAGKGWFAFGMNFQHSNYSRYNDIDTESGDLVFYLRHDACCNNAFFEGDLIQTQLRMNLSTTTTSFLFNYGLSNRFDVSASLPIVRTSLEASVVATIQRYATASFIPLVHAFAGAGDPTTRTTTAEGTSTGIGDILVRGKYRFRDLAGGGLAAGVDVRLPTGSAEDLLGTGAAQTTLLFIASSTHGRIAPHFNVAYTISGNSDTIGEIPNEFGYRGGVEVVVNPSVTLSADLLGRSLLDTTVLELGTTTHTFRTSANAPVQTTTFSEFQASTGSLNISSAAIGGKFNVGGNLLVSASVLFPLNSAGIRSRITPVFGFEYSFDRSR